MQRSRISEPGQPADPTTGRTLFPEERDVADRLPDIAREKLFALREAADNARAIASVPYESLKQTNEKIRNITSRIAYIENNPGSPDRDALLAKERSTLTGLKDKAAAKSEEYQVKKERWQHLGELVRSLEEYTAQLPAKIDLAVTPPLFKIVKPLPEMVADARARIEKHRSAVVAAIDAPITSSEAKARAASQIDALATTGEPDVVGVLEGGKLQWPTVQTNEIGPPKIDAAALFAWLNRDQLIAAINAEIDRFADDGAALTTALRAEKIKAAKAAAFTEERIEEALIVLGAEQGLVIPRRSDADPRAILSLSDNMPEPRE